jgi:hypothetical protein
VPVTELGRECLLAGLGVEVRYATTCDQAQSFHVLKLGVARAIKRARASQLLRQGV